MKSGKLLIFIFGIILLFSSVAAVTTINIKTLPYQNLHITPVKIGADFETLHAPQFFSADKSGNLKLEFEDFSVSVFEVLVILKDADGNTVYRTKSEENFATGTEIFFTAAPEGAKLVEDKNVTAPEEESLDLNITLGEGFNESLNETLNETNSSLNLTNLSGDLSGLSGEVVGNQNESFNFRKLIFILAGLVFLVIVYIIIKEEAEKGVFKNFGRNFKFDSGEKKGNVKSKNYLDRTKDDLRDAKEKVKALEKKEKIEEVRARLDKDEEALKRLEDEQDEIIRKKR